MDDSDRRRLKNKISEISRGFEGLIMKIDEMPSRDFENVEKEIDEFRFRYGKVLNLSPEGQKGERPLWRGSAW